MNTPGSAGTASDGYRVPVREGRHRAPPPPPTPPTAAWWTVAVAAGVLTMASVAAIGVDVAPDARSATCSPHPIEGVIPCPPAAAVDANGLALTRPIARPATSTSALSPTSTSTAPDRLAASTRRPSPSATANLSSSLPSMASGLRWWDQGSTPVLEMTLTPQSASSPEVTPPPQPVTTQQAADAPPPTVAAADSSATTEEPTVTTTAASTTRRTGRRK